MESREWNTQGHVHDSDASALRSGLLTRDAFSFSEMLNMEPERMYQSCIAPMSYIARLYFQVLASSRHRVTVASCGDVITDIALRSARGLPGDARQRCAARGAALERLPLEGCPGRHCHSARPLAVIDCHSVGIYTGVLLPLLSFSAKMTVSRPGLLEGPEPCVG